MFPRPLFILTTLALVHLQVLSVSSSSLFTRALSNGSKCSTSTQCQSQNCYRAHCADKVPNGHYCYKDVGCISGSCYSASVCYTPGDGVLANGASCKTSSVCASAYCKHSSCDDKKPNGHVCYKNEGCISGSCINKACSVVSTPSSSSSTTKPTSTSTTSSSSSTPTKTTSTTSTITSTTSSSSSTSHSSSSSSPTSHSSSSKPTSTSTTSSTSSSTSSSVSPKPTIKCTLADTSLVVLNIYGFYYSSVDPRAFPDPILTFTNLKDPSGNVILTSANRQAKHLDVDFYDCKSTYMGYQDNPSLYGGPDGADDANYGQLRIPSLNNDCLTAVSPLGGTTTITHKACSTVDDQSQISQFFGLFGTDLGVGVVYLGGSLSQTGSISGYDYAAGDTTPGVAYTLTKQAPQTDPSVQPMLSFYVSGDN